MPTRQQKLDDIETKISRWLARSRRAQNALHKLMKQKTRLSKGPSVKLERVLGDIVELANDGQGIIDKVEDAFDIPPELNRADPLIAEKMTAARKKAEAEARKAMPLSGKAALDYIKAPRKRKA